MAFETIHSERAYQGKVFDVRRDQVRLPNGAETQLDIVEHEPSVSLLPVDSEGRVWFVRQYRHAAGRDLLELPAGVIDPGESPEECAQRELREEIGMAAGRLEPIGGFFLAPGYSSEYMYVFLAEDLSPAPLEGDEDEVISVEQIPLDEALRLANQGGIDDAKSLAALLLARGHLERR